MLFYNKRRFLFLLLTVVLIGCSANREPVSLEGPVDCRPQNFEDTREWSAVEISRICSLWIGNLDPLPPDPTNQYADNPAAAELGHHFFFDTRLSASGEIACATCHQADKNFTDGLSTPIGGGPRRSQTIVGTAYSPFFFWDGHKDSQWAQALEPLESQLEHAGTRDQYAALIAADPAYRTQYEAIFGALPDVTTADGATAVFVNIGKAIAAYERLIMPASSPFDAYAQAVLADDRPTMRSALSADERAGLSLYINEAQCLNCHNDPLFTNHAFHNTAVFGAYDPGRALGAQLVLTDEFNCRSQWSDAAADACLELDFIRTEGAELEAAFKTPTLRNVAEAAPYGHNGAFDSLSDILEHYNAGGLGIALGDVGHNELVPLNLTAEELDQLEAFLRTLSGGIDAAERWLVAPTTTAAP